jgi:hypothetical protein
MLMFDFQLLQEEMFSEILENLVLYIQNCHMNKASNIIRNEVPSATLLTGTVAVNVYFY